MADDVKLEILLAAKNQSEQAFRELKGQLSGIQTEIAKTAKTAETGLNFGVLAARATAAAAGIYAAFRAVGQVVEMAKVGSVLEKQAVAFDNLAGAAGTSAQRMIASLKSVSGGLVAEADLMSAAGKAMLMSIPADKITQLMKIAAATSRATGQTITEAFNDITMGVARQSKMILDNLGIIVDVEAANKDYAASLGKTATALTDTEKRQAFMNSVLKSGADMMARLGESRGTLDGVNQLVAAQSNLWAEITKLVNKELNPAFTATATIVEAIARGVKNVRTGISDLSSAAVEDNISRARAALANPELGPQQRKYLEDRLRQLEAQRGTLGATQHEAMRLRGKGAGEPYVPKMSDFIGTTEAQRLWNYKPDSTIIDTGYLAFVEKEKDANKLAAEALRKHIEMIEEYAQVAATQFSGTGGWASEARFGASRSMSDQNAVAYAQSVEDARAAMAKSDGAANAERWWAAYVGGAEDATRANEIFADSMNVMSQSAADAFAEFVMGTKSAADAFASMTQSMISALVRLSTQKFAEQIFAGIGSALPGLFSGGSTPTGMTTNFTQPFFATVKHGGGMGYEPGPQRALPAALFAHAPRLHSGIGPGEYPAVLRRDEAVLTPGQLAAVGKTQVVVNNYGNERASVTEQQDPGGMRKIFVTIGSDIQAGGPIARSMESAYGLRRRGRLG